MITGSLKVRPATAADIKKWAGDELLPTITAVVGELDGRVVAIGGFGHVNGRIVAFCDLLPAARAFKLVIARTAFRMMAEAKKRHRFVFASADPDEPGSAHWLSRLGFDQINEEANLWRWSNK